jgi:hypothetical protein
MVSIREGLEEQFKAEHGNKFNNLWKDEDKKFFYE